MWLADTPIIPYGEAEARLPVSEANEIISLPVQPVGRRSSRTSMSCIAMRPQQPLLPLSRHGWPT